MRELKIKTALFGSSIFAKITMKSIAFKSTVTNVNLAKN